MPFFIVGCILYTVLAIVRTFCLGYGMSRCCLSILCVADDAMFIGLGLCGIIGFIRFFDNKARRISVIVLSRMALLLLFGSLAFVLPNRVARQVRQYGAETRLDDLGGVSFETELKADARKLWVDGRDADKFIAYEELPETFKRLGGIFAFRDYTPYDSIDIVTSHRPKKSGWIIVVEDENCLESKAVKVGDRIYRY